MTMLGGLAEGEMGNLQEVFDLSRAEIETFQLDGKRGGPVDDKPGCALVQGTFS